MIISDISIGKQTKKPVITQRIKISCDNCSKEWESTLSNQIKGLKTYNKDLCRSCKQIEQNKQGLRKDQYKKAGEGAKRNLTGKTFDELHGIEKSNEIKNKISNKVKGELNPNFGGKYSHGFGDLDQKGKTIEELWGDEIGKRLRKHYSDTRKGSNNNMFGKPSPAGSGNGWSGWYKGWLFRSLLELSYVINVLERFGFNWESAENTNYKIPYKNHDNISKNYYPDFIVNEKYLIEVKPKHLYDSYNVIEKKNNAINFCKEHNLIYKLTTPIKTLKFKDIKILVDNGYITFTKRYEEKYQKYLNETIK